MKRSRVIAGLSLVLAAAAGVAVAAGSGSPSPDPFDSLPSTIHLSGVVHDFRARNVAGGHPDFELNPSGGAGHYVGMVADDLDSEGRPVMVSAGYKVSSQWKDVHERPICKAKAYISSRPGDQAGVAAGSQGGALTSADRFAQWFRDVPGVNMSALVSIDLVRQPNTNRYLFDDQLDTRYRGEGFFTVNNQLYGNGAQGGNRNYDWTYYIDTTVQYRAGQDQYFKIGGQDDIWMFIDGKLVIDMGGIGGTAPDQRIDLDRLTWLTDGQEIRVQIFYAHRNRPSAHFRLETSMALQSVSPPPVTNQFD